jgi:putative transposase
MLVRYRSRFFLSAPQRRFLAETFGGKRCSDCRHVLEDLPLRVREWTCPNCGTVHDRELNAAKNLLSAGQAASARGGHVNPKATQVAKGNARRSVNQPALP